MIIVEGIDRVGKTTLVNLLKEKTGLPVIEDKYIYNDLSNRCNMAANTEKIQTIINMSRDVSDKFIADRLHWSEYVYGFFDRGYQNKKVFELEKQLVDLNAKIILVVPTDIKESSRQHGKDLSKYNNAFNGLYLNTRLDKFKCNYNSLNEAVEWAVEK